MDTRIYSVAVGEVVRLVRATNQAQALRHAAKSTFTVKVASQDDIVAAVTSGVKVEDASKDVE